MTFLDLSVLVYRHLADCCEHGEEPSGSIIFGHILNQLRNSYFLKEGLCSMNLLIISLALTYMYISHVSIGKLSVDSVIK